MSYLTNKINFFFFIVCIIVSYNFSNSLYLSKNLDLKITSHQAATKINNDKLEPFPNWSDWYWMQVDDKKQVIIYKSYDKCFKDCPGQNCQWTQYEDLKFLSNSEFNLICLINTQPLDPSSEKEIGIKRAFENESLCNSYCQPVKMEKCEIKKIKINKLESNHESEKLGWRYLC
jgi:hypothetical protein